MSKSRIAMIDGYDVERHLAGARFSAAEDVQQARFDEAKRRIQALIPINDALYDALKWYQAQAIAVKLMPGVNAIAAILNSYPVSRMEWEVDNWHTQALRLMADDNYLYDVAADDARFTLFSDTLDKFVSDASDIGFRLNHSGIRASVQEFMRTFPTALGKAAKMWWDTGGSVLRAAGLDLGALKPYLIGGALLLGAAYLLPLLSKPSRS